MAKLRIKKKNSALLQIVTAVVLLIALLLAIHFITHSHNSTPKASLQTNNSSTTITNSNPSTPASNPYAILSPAAVPSKTAECTQALTFASNGDSGPAACSNGDLNITEWNALAALEPSVLKLGYNASSAQVQAAICADINTNIISAIESTVYQIAALYYGWNFNPAPSVSHC